MNADEAGTKEFPRCCPYCVELIANWASLDICQPWYLQVQTEVSLLRWRRLSSSSHWQGINRRKCSDQMWDLYKSAHVKCKWSRGGTTGMATLLCVLWPLTDLAIPLFAPRIVLKSSIFDPIMLTLTLKIMHSANSFNCERNTVNFYPWTSLEASSSDPTLASRMGGHRTFLSVPPTL